MNPYSEQQFGRPSGSESPVIPETGFESSVPEADLQPTQAITESVLPMEKEVAPANLEGMLPAPVKPSPTFGQVWEMMHSDLPISQFAGVTLEVRQSNEGSV